MYYSIADFVVLHLKRNNNHLYFLFYLSIVEEVWWMMAILVNFLCCELMYTIYIKMFLVNVEKDLR